MARRTHTEAWWEAASPTVIRCTAHYKDGTPCKTEASPGTNVCDKHGALAPQVLNAAAVRIQMTADDAAAKLVAWMNDSTVDMRERVKIAHDLLDRGGLSGVNKVLVGVGQIDPIEALFRNLLSDPNALIDPNAEPLPPDPLTLELNRAAIESAEGPDWADIVDAELIEEPASPARIPSLERSTRNPATPPKHIREAMERLL